MKCFSFVSLLLLLGSTVPARAAGTVSVPVSRIQAPPKEPEAKTAREGVTTAMAPTKKMLPACLKTDPAGIEWTVREHQIGCTAKCPAGFKPGVWQQFVETSEGTRPMANCVCCPDL